VPLEEKGKCHGKKKRIYQPRQWNEKETRWMKTKRKNN
jgi:hypothetical protein